MSFIAVSPYWESWIVLYLRPRVNCTDEIVVDPHEPDRFSQSIIWNIWNMMEDDLQWSLFLSLCLGEVAKFNYQYSPVIQWVVHLTPHANWHKQQMTTVAMTTALIPASRARKTTEKPSLKLLKLKMSLISALLSCFFSLMAKTT